MTKQEQILAYIRQANQALDWANSLFKDDDAQPECPHCKIPMVPVWQNNGYTEPEGPSYHEITHLYCPKCGEVEE